MTMDHVRRAPNPRAGQARGHADGHSNQASRRNSRALSRDRRAVTALEYGIIAGVLGLNLIGIFKRFGTGLSTLFSTISSSI